MRELRVYWQFVRVGFSRESRYLLAAAGGLAANLVFGFLKASVLLGAVAAGGGKVAGYTAGTVGAYVWLSQGLLGSVALLSKAEIGDRIRTGDIAIDFLRPVDVQLSHLSVDLGRGAFNLLPRGLPSVLVGALTFGFSMPTTVLPYALGLVSILLGISISFLCRFAVSLAGLWIVETRGLQTFYVVLSSFFAGLFVPVPLLPGWLGRVAYSTPFPSILQAPVDVLSGRVVGTAALQAVGLQLFWVIAVGALGQVVLRAGRRKLEVQGG